MGEGGGSSPIRVFRMGEVGRGSEWGLNSRRNSLA